MAARKLSFSLSLCTCSQWRGHTRRASFSELAVTAGQSTARALLLSVCSMQRSSSVSANAGITPTHPGQEKACVCFPMHSNCTSVFPCSKSRPHLMPVIVVIDEDLKKMMSRIWMLCVTVAQNVTFMYFLWLLYHQLKFRSTIFCSSGVVRESLFLSS